jgi:hypothetical protein
MIGAETAQEIAGIILMNNIFYCFIFLCAALSCLTEISISMEALSKRTVNYLDISQKLLEHIKYDEPYTDEISILKEANINNLLLDLKDDSAKKAFLINLYNSFAQILIKDNPAHYEDRKSFFNYNVFTVADCKISLNDIEKCMLRREKPRLIPYIIYDRFISNFKRLCRVEKCDYRIHFALNCNARSCPPILYYDAALIEDQLTLATGAYLKSSVEYTREENIILLPEIFIWYKSDFGGDVGILNILRQHNIIAPSDYPLFRYKKWDWAPVIKHFQ